MLPTYVTSLPSPHLPPSPPRSTPFPLLGAPTHARACVVMPALLIHPVFNMLCSVTALRACAIMASWMGDNALSATYAARAKMSSVNYQKKCWNPAFG